MELGGAMGVCLHIIRRQSGDQPGAEPSQVQNSHLRLSRASGFCLDLEPLIGAAYRRCVVHTVFSGRERKSGSAALIHQRYGMI